MFVSSVLVPCLRCERPWPGRSWQVSGGADWLAGLISADLRAGQNVNTEQPAALQMFDINTLHLLSPHVKGLQPCTLLYTVLLEPAM